MSLLTAPDGSPRHVRSSPQTPVAVIVIRPHHFVANPETAVDNSFQDKMAGAGQEDKVEAYHEVSNVIKVLRSHGVKVHVFEDESCQTPDSVFPNNWFSTHAGGRVAIYPMFAKNRRKERRTDIIELLKKNYRVQDIVDYSGFEEDGLFLEGTGAMVLDHIERVTYVCKSRRSDPILLERFCSQFNYEPIIFEAVDSKGHAVYHTNVLMCIASELVLVGAELVRDNGDRATLMRRLKDTGRKILELSEEQVASFSGNMLEVQGANGPLLVMSETAYRALSGEQITQIEQCLPIVTLAIPTIEKAGGSVRCMLAGVHLSKRL
ncbi:citrulline utilization hydrolase CtlX [Kiloniella majae]|uniref:citrulline utilization hydrolase CtlX n=1 Tax=Kiloniella majae TaxID=1938558 RepID=UPI000A2782FE|nr:arginine deiminase-related protein [Kiloniella majae]